MTESSNYEVKKKNIREQTIDNLIKTLEKDPSIWHKTWQKLATNRPYNPITGTKYKGINLINLALSSTSDSRWATYEQAKKAGFPVKKGERSLASVIYHKVNASIEINDKKYPLKSSNQTDLLNEIKVIFSKYSPRHLSLIPSNNSLMIFINTIEHNSEIKFNRNVLVTGIPVFNYTQLSNAPKLESPMLKQEWSDYERAENLLKATNVPIIHDQYDNNFYLPSKNEIHLTPKASFYTPEGYYSTAFHEVAHAKMNDGSIDLGIDLTKYGVDKHIRAKEELRAELSAVFTCAELEINYNVQNHANYINSWLKIFKEDKSELWSALSDSSKVADLIIDYESIIEQEAVYDELEVVTPDSNKELDQPVLTNNEFNIKENKGIDL